MDIYLYNVCNNLSYQGTSAHTYKKKIEKHFYQVVFILCTLCYTICDDLPRHIACNHVKNFRTYKFYCGNHCRMVWSEPFQSCTVMLHIGIYNRIFYCIKKLTQKCQHLYPLNLYPTPQIVSIN